MDTAIPAPVHAATSVATGPIPKAERVLAPDLIRGAAFLLIPLGNVGYYLWGRTVGYGSPPAASLVDRVLDVAGLWSFWVRCMGWPLWRVPSAS